MTTKSLRDHIQSTATTKTQNRGDVEEMEMFVFCIRENGSEWKSSLVTPPEHKSKSHNTTHTHRNHPNLATFRTAGRWCNLEIAQIIVLTCPVCAHLQTRAFFGVWLIVKIVIFCSSVLHTILLFLFVRTYCHPEDHGCAHAIFRWRFVSIVFVHFSRSRSLFVVSIGHEIRQCRKQRDLFWTSNLHGYTLLTNLSESSFY